jgi:hypothetical protein
MNDRDITAPQITAMLVEHLNQKVYTIKAKETVASIRRLPSVNDLVTDLLHQIQISDYKDENGHRLVDNEAYLRLREGL